MTPTSLLRNPALSSHAVRLWSVLASYTYGDRATDRPSRAQLAADVGWKSPRSVDGYLAELQDAGYLTVQRRWRPDGGKARNLYISSGNPRTAPPRTGQAGRTLWTTLFPQLTPMRRILPMGVPRTPEAVWITPRRCRSGTCARFCPWGHDARHPWAGLCACPWAGFCASWKRINNQERRTTSGPAAVAGPIPRSAGDRTECPSDRSGRRVRRAGSGDPGPAAGPAAGAAEHRDAAHQGAGVGRRRLDGPATGGGRC